jgi:NAD(P)-dependent dehydrogenase (short-subunit alcohol dehydrogenase family)
VAFKNQVAVITGGASGIGLALCRELTRRGAIVVTGDISLKGAHALDVRRPEQVQALVDETVRQHGRIDFMFNNAGIACGGEVRDLTLEHWRQVIEVNLMGVIHGVAAAYPVMLRQGAGHIVNIASLAGLIASPGLAPYATTKSAVVGLSNALRAEAEALGVRVSVVCPSFIKTAIFENAIGASFDRIELQKRLTLPMMQVEDAVETILKGVERNRGTIVFPASARLLWRLNRISPAILSPFRKKMLSTLRSMRPTRP